MEGLKDSIAQLAAGVASSCHAPSTPPIIKTLFDKKHITSNITEKVGKIYESPISLLVFKALSGTAQLHQ
jgi:hypothetical protein